jgi:hypothetical protein
VHEFILIGKKGCFVQITIEEVFDFPNMTSHFGGYDARGTVEIKSGNYYVRVSCGYQQVKCTSSTIS